MADAARVVKKKAQKPKKSRIKSRKARAKARLGRRGKGNTQTGANLVSSSMRSQIQNAKKQNQRPRKFHRGINKALRSSNAKLIMTLGALKFPYRTMVIPLHGSYVMLLTPATRAGVAASLELGYKSSGSISALSSDVSAVKRGTLTPEMINRAIDGHAAQLANGKRSLQAFSATTIAIQR